MLNVQNFQVLLTVLFSMFCLILRRTQNYLLHDINWLVLKTIISVFTVRCSWIFKYNWGYPWYLKGSTNTTANSSACSSHVRIIQSAFHTHSYCFFTDTIIYIYIYTYIYIYIYAGCPRRNVRDFGKVFLMLNYTDVTQNTYIQSWTVTEIMAIEKCLGCPRTVRRPWRHTHPLRMPCN